MLVKSRFFLISTPLKSPILIDHCKVQNRRLVIWLEYGRTKFQIALQLLKLIRRNKEVVLCLVQIDRHTYISAMYVYIYYLFVWDYSFEGLAPIISLFCEAIYVGKTERNLKIRMSEHLRDFKNKKRENSLADHLNLNNHSFPEGIKLIKAERETAN